MVGAIFPGAERLVYATLPRGVYLVVGPPGVGKTCFIYTSLAHWLKRKFPGIILVTDVSPRVVFEDFNRIGVSKEVSEDLLRIVDCYSAKAGKSSETKYVVKSPDNPTEINILLSESLSGVKEPMVCIDSMNSLVSPFEDKPQLARGLVERIVANLRENGSYSLVTMTSGVSEERLTRFVESIVDGVIEMRMVESNTEELRRQLRYKIVKEKHESRWMFFNIFGRGIIGVTSVALPRFENVGAELCRRALESGCRMAWLGVVDEFFRKVIPIADMGFEEGYLTTIDIDLDDPKRGYGPAGTAARTGRRVIINDVAVEPSFEPWREDALKRGYYSCAALPVNVDGRPIAVLTIYYGSREIPSDLIKDLESSVKDAEKSLSKVSLM